MAARPNRPVFLSLALHSAVFAILVVSTRLGPPPAEPTRVIQVVWIEPGPSDLAAKSFGAEGRSDVVETEIDEAGEEVPKVEAVENDHPAPLDLQALASASAADRPAAEPAAVEEVAQTEEADGTELANAEEILEEYSPDGAPGETPPAEPALVSDVPLPDAPVRPNPPPAIATAAELLVIETDRTELGIGQQPVERMYEETRAAAAVVEPSVTQPAPGTPKPAPSEPLAAAEQEMLHEKVTDWTNRFRDIPSRPSIAWSHDGYEYLAEFTRLPAESAMGIEEALVEIHTERDGRQVSTQARLKRLAFSHYGQFIDRWDPNVQIHDDEIDGRFHSNSEIYIEHSGGIQPVFHDKVTARGVNTSRSSRRVSRDEIFLGGIDTRASRIALPKRFVPPDELSAEDAQVIELHSDTRIRFRADGTYTLRSVGASNVQTGSLGPAATYFIAADKWTVGIAGTLNGKALVYSRKEIVIEGNLIYASDPSRLAQSDDYLGLVSDGSVEIADPATTGPGDLTVHAAIYAKGRFAVRRYGKAEHATLSVYGSITAGSLTATEPRYRTRLVFDRRLEETRPPHFPMTDQYELASWDGVWRVGGKSN